MQIARQRQRQQWSLDGKVGAAMSRSAAAVASCNVTWPIAPLMRDT